MRNQFVYLILIACFLQFIFCENKTNVTDFINQMAPKAEHQFYVGYLHVGNQNSSLFYQLVSAKGKDFSQKDIPLILWLQGGPGATSQFAAFNEFGPYIVNKQNGSFTLIDRPFNWAQEYHILFVDQPMGVGYSYIKNDNIPNSTVESAEQMEQFLLEFYQVYPELNDNPFYITGESYAGHWIPALASRIIKNKSMRIDGVSVGDGLTNPIKQVYGYSSYAYAAGIISGSRRKKLELIEGRVVSDINNGNYFEASDLYDLFNNGDRQESLPYLSGGIDIENYRHYPASDPVDPNENAWIDFLQDPKTKAAFNIPDGVVFDLNAGDIYNNFYYDIPLSFADDYTLILENTKLLLYSGQDDANVPTPGSLTWINALKGTEFYKKATKQIWDINGRVVGSIKKAGNFQFRVVYKAGHLVPHDQGESGFNMIQNFINS